MAIFNEGTGQQVKMSGWQETISDSLKNSYLQMQTDQIIAQKAAVSPTMAIKEESPTSILDKDPLGYRQISYPKDINSMQNGHYIIFYVNVRNKSGYEYKDPEGKRVGGVVEREILRTSPHLDKPVKTGKFVYYEAEGDEIEYQKQFVAKGGKGNYIKSDEVLLTQNDKWNNSKYGQSGGISSLYKTTTRISDSVALYLPPSVKDTTAATYDDSTTGIVGLVASGGGAFLDAMKRNDYQAAARSLIGGVKAVSEEALRQAGGMFIDTLAGTEGSAELANLAFGQATNPYMEVMFTNMGIRTFSYAFTFSPRNEDERDDVQAIIKLFRFHMAPELKGAQHRFLTLPSTFDIHYMYQATPETAKENSFYSKIATCVCDSVDVDYTPGGVRSFQDGSPTQIVMTLSFKETELLNKQMINAGY